MSMCISEFDVILPPRLAEKYEIIACLKHGERRQTSLIRRIGDGAQFVMKCSVDGHEDLAAEYALLAQFHGDGIPDAIDFFSDDGVSFLIREYIAGQTLLDYMQKRGILPTDEAVDIMLSVCRIVKRLHTQSPPVIHRDIKAENIIRTNDGRIVLIDFGIARRYDPDIRQDTHVLGTPLYAPPEQYGYRQTDTRSDIYSIGVLMHELLTGESELGSGSADAEVADIIDRCTRFDPDDRYRDAEALERALEALSSKRRRFLSRTAVIAVAVVIIIAAIAVGVRAVLMHSQGGGDVSESMDTEQTGESNDNIDYAAYYKFASPAIEAEVCRMLNKEPGQVTYADLTFINTLLLCGDAAFEEWDDILIHGAAIQIDYVEVDEKGTVDTLEDIAFMPNLRTLALCNQNITDLEPLRGSGIERLALHGNRIRDLEPLEGSEKLYNLILSDNPIDDISPLSGMGIHFLNIGATMVSDLRPLEEIETLYRVDIIDCPLLSDISPLESVKTLHTLIIRPVSAEQLSVIKRMSQVESLAIWHVEGLSDFHDLDALDSLERIFVDSPGIKSLEGLSQFDTLKRLDVRTYAETDLEPLTRFRSLAEISFLGLYVTDWEPLCRMPALERIDCTADQYEQIKEMIGDRDIDIKVY